MLKIPLLFYIYTLLIQKNIVTLHPQTHAEPPRKRMERLSGGALYYGMRR